MKQTLAPKVHPISPHSQRLLAAQAREAKGVPTPKAKGKAEMKKPAAKKQKTTKHTENQKDKKDDSNNITPSRTDYTEAKKKWIAEILDSI